MKLLDYLNKDLIVTRFKAKNKDQALRKISEISSKNSNLAGISEDEIYKKLLEREKLGSTGFSHGIAIPHIRIKGLANFVVGFFISNTGIKFDSADHKKSHLFAVIFAPEEKVQDNLKLLARISRLLSNRYFQKELLKSQTAEIVYETISRYCSDKEDDDIEKQKMKLLYIILYYEDYLTDILEYLIERGIEGANIIQSSGMGMYVSNIPIFASLLGFMKEDRYSSTTIMALIPEETESTIIKGLEAITGNMDKKQGAMVITQDISFYKGSMKMF